MSDPSLSHSYTARSSFRKMNAVNESMRLYCAIHRAAAKMPTKDRINFIRRRLRAEYDTHREETNPDRLR